MGQLWTYPATGFPLPTLDDHRHDTDATLLRVLQLEHAVLLVMFLRVYPDLEFLIPKELFFIVDL